MAQPSKKPARKTAKKKMGRPKGSKNRKTKLYHEIMTDAPVRRQPKLGHVNGAAVGLGRMTERLGEVLKMKACHVNLANDYAQGVGLNPRTCTVLDTIIHCQLLQTYKGSAPHMQQIWDRIDGRVPTPVQVDARVESRAVRVDALHLDLDTRRRILDAVQSFCLAKNPDTLDLVDNGNGDA